MIRIKIMMSSYNGEKYIEEQIKSILSQEGVNVELFIRDDGSSDGTTTILNKIASANSNIHVEFAKNEGPSASFMDLLYTQNNTEEYDYYAFSDQDDIWEPDKLKRAVDILENERIPALYYSALLTFKENTGEQKLVVIDREYSFAETFFQSHYPGCTMVLNRLGMNLILGVKKPEIAVMHDLFIAQVFLGTDNIIIYDKESRINYRVHGDNVSVKKDNAIGEFRRYKKIFDKQKGLRLSAAKAYKEVMGTKVNPSKLQILNVITGYRNNIKSRIQLVEMIAHSGFCLKIKCLFITAVMIGFY